MIFFRTDNKVTSVDEIRNNSVLSRTTGSGFVTELRRKLRKDPNFFNRLTPLNSDVKNLKIYNEKKENVLIKYCGITFPDKKTVDWWNKVKPLGELESSFYRNPAMHGAYTHKYFEFFAKHQEAVESKLINPEKYVLLPIRLHGRVNVDVGRGVLLKFIIIDRLRDLRDEPKQPNTSINPEDLKNAINEAVKNSRDLLGSASNLYIPQIEESLVLGWVNTWLHRNKKWVLAPPHDSA